MTTVGRELARLLALLLLSALALQVFFVARVALMARIDPQSTSFQRSEVWRLLHDHRRFQWSREWVAYAGMSSQLKRAVIAAEDAGFAEHSGVEWDALERAWERNQRASVVNPQAARLVGGSTITQQLAKNLFLGGERSWLRKSQEFAITLMLEALLSKRRILEIYLNHVEWGEGVFGAQAAARHYFRIDASRLDASQAARLAVLLPAPKRFEKRIGSAYLTGRTRTITARMPAIDVP